MESYDNTPIPADDDAIMARLITELDATKVDLDHAKALVASLQERYDTIEQMIGAFDLVFGKPTPANPPLRLVVVTEPASATDEAVTVAVAEQPEAAPFRSQLTVTVIDGEPHLGIPESDPNRHDGIDYLNLPLSKAIQRYADAHGGVIAVDEIAVELARAGRYPNVREAKNNVASRMCKPPLRRHFDRIEPGVWAER